MNENTLPAAVGSSAELGALISEARDLCEIDYCFGQADRDAKERRAWALISRLSQLEVDQVAAERERCAKLCEWLPIGTGLQGKTFAEAIRGEGTGGKMAEGFRA